MRGYAGGRGLSQSHVFVAKELLRRAGVPTVSAPGNQDDHNSADGDRSLARTPAGAGTRPSVTRKPKDTFLRKSNGHPWEHTQPVGPGSASPDPFAPSAVIDAGDGVVPADLPLDRCEVRATLAFAPVSALVPGVSPFAILQAPTLLSSSGGDGVPLMVHGRRMVQQLHRDRVARELGSSRYVAHVMHARGLVFSDKCGFAFNTTFQALSYDNRQLETQTVHLAAVVRRKGGLWTLLCCYLTSVSGCDRTEHTGHSAATGCRDVRDTASVEQQRCSANVGGVCLYARAA